MNYKKVVFLGVLILSLCGCAEKQLTVPETAPFKKAVTLYLKDNSMEMKVVDFKTLNIDGDTAISVVILQDIEGLYAIKPKWRFEFKKTEGEWQVMNYKVVR